MIELSESAKANGTYVVTANFSDPDGTAFVPKSCQWSLTDKDGNIINSRERVPVLITASEHNFVLSGFDLSFTTGALRDSRIFTIEGTFDSVYGSGLPFWEECQFPIERKTLKEPV